MIFSSYAQKFSGRAKIFRIATLACYKGFWASAATFVSGLAMFIHKSDIAEEKPATGTLIAIAIAIKPWSFNFSSCVTTC